MSAAIGCRRCSECIGAEHHWIDNEDIDDADDPTHACKHCDAVGDECETCDGEGGRTSEDGYALGLCPRCHGHGVSVRLALPTPDPMTSFKIIDAWLRDRGWEDTGNGWKSRTNTTVTIATHEEAQRIQRRRDRCAPGPPGGGRT